MNKYIVATSGGFISTKRWGVVKPGATFLKALELTKKDRPKVCFIMTASVFTSFIHYIYFNKKKLYNKII